MRTVAQDAASMNAALDGIWRMGDRDECSVKHIGHATAALGAGRDWSEGVDYSSPWGADETWILTANLHAPGPDDAHAFEDWTIIPWTEQVKSMKASQLAKRWAKVQEKRDAWGVDRFNEVMSGTKFAWYHEQNLKLYWQDNAN